MKGSTIGVIIAIIVVAGILIWGGLTHWWGYKSSYSATPSTTTPSSTPSTTSPTTPSATTPSSQTNSAQSSVSIKNLAFNPASLTVTAGTKVTWTNNDTVAHTVTSDNGTFSSSQIQPGGTFEFTFTKAGEYSYHCSIHPMMTAKVVVQ